MRRLIAALVFVLGCSEPTGTSVPLRFSLVPNTHPVIVRLKENAPASANAKHRYTRVFNGYSADVTDSELESLKHNPNVLSVSPDQTASLSILSWGLDRIDQRSGQDGQFFPQGDGSGVTAYIIDSGIRYTHGEFGGRASSGADFTGGSGEDCLGHGTHVAGTVGGTGAGVAKKVSLVSVRVFGCEGSAPYSVVLAGMDWVAQNAQLPAVVNMSLGGPAYPPIDEAVQNMTARGITLVVAAGNDALDACNYSPARAPSAVTVGASDASDMRASFSNWGNCLDIFAPGYRIVSAWSSADNAYATASGTSMASPHVAGVAALILHDNPLFTPRQVDSALYARSTKSIVQDARSPKWHIVYTGLDDMAETLPAPVAPELPQAPSNLRIEIVSFLKGKDKPVLLRATWDDDYSPHPDYYNLTADGMGNRVIYWPSKSLEFTVASGSYDFYLSSINAFGSSLSAGPVHVDACQKCNGTVNNKGK